jgi:hypothetical protein
MRNTSLILALLLTVLGCDHRQPASQPASAPAGNLVFRDTKGDVIADADVELPDKLPAGDGTFTGRWKLLSFKPAFPSGSTQSGRYQGSAQGGLTSIDLNPAAADNNVVFSWPTGTEPITGTWYHATFSGGKPMGTFTLTRRPGGVR